MLDDNFSVIVVTELLRARIWQKIVTKIKSNFLQINKRLFGNYLREMEKKLRLASYALSKIGVKHFCTSRKNSSKINRQITDIDTYFTSLLRFT